MATFEQCPEGLRGGGTNVRVFVVEHCRFTGDIRTAVAQARRGAAGVEETGATNIGMIFTQRGLGISHALAGEWREALAALERSLDISHKAGSFLQAEPTTLVWMARVLVPLGEIDRARETLARARALGEQQLSRLPLPFAALVDAMIMRASGAPREEVEAALGRALEVAREHARGYEPLVHLEHADYAGEVGDDKKRRRELETGRDLLAEMGATTRAEQVTRELS